MAAENTEPRSVLILQLAALSIVSLVVIRYSLVSYFDAQMQGEYMRKVGDKKSAQLVALHADEQKMLTGGAMPIDKAMTILAKSGGERMAMLPPKASEDMAPMLGWTLAPNPAGSAMAAAHADAGTLAAGDAGVAAGDAGASTNDAGGPKTTALAPVTIDAGAPAKNDAGGTGK